jgi:transposase-like protein
MEAGVTRPKRKPDLSEEMAMLQEENAKLRKAKAYLEMELAIARLDLMDWMQRTAQRREQE